MDFLKKIVGKNIVTVFVILAVFLIVIPLPTWLLDLLFAVNIALSVYILLTTMYIKESLEFSIFPSLLLITTVFRLGLNISSTRSILMNKGYAGEIPELKFDCDCRKPKPGMIFTACRELGIDAGQSFMVGDKPRDVECGEAAGAKGVLYAGGSLLACVKQAIG